MNFKNYQNFFKNKKIFITGNTGFVGSYLSLTLSLMCSKVVGYSLKKNNLNYLSNFRKYKNRIKTINDDIKNIENYKNYLKKFKPEIVIHLAAQPIVQESYKNTIKTFETNIFGTIKLFETLKKVNSIKQILIFTSDKVYKNQDNPYLTEESNIGGFDPYSASKSSQDIIASSYKESFFKSKKNIIIIRAGNIVGGGDWEISRLIPEVFNSIYNKKKIILRNPNAIRPWQHIFDVVNGIILVLFKKNSKIEKKSIIYNIGPSHKSNITVLDLVKKIKKMNMNLKISFSKKNIYFRESKILKLSNNLFKKEVGWKPKININKSLKLIQEWHYEFYIKKNNIFEFTVKQIKHFFDN